jgi:hypothetical protein
LALALAWGSASASVKELASVKGWETGSELAPDWG